MSEEQQQRQKQKQALSIKSMAFNRFLLFRYVTAVFFFANLYWTILLLGAPGWYWLLPSILFLIDIAISIEQTRKYWQPDHSLVITRVGYWAQLACNIVLISATLMKASQPFYPFINGQSQQAIFIALGIGVVFCIFVQRQAWLISHDQDRYLQRLNEFKASLQ